MNGRSSYSHKTGNPQKLPGTTRLQSAWPDMMLYSAAHQKVFQPPEEVLTSEAPTQLSAVAILLEATLEAPDEGLLYIWQELRASSEPPNPFVNYFINSGAISEIRAHCVQSRTEGTETFGEKIRLHQEKWLIRVALRRNKGWESGAQKLSEI